MNDKAYIVIADGHASDGYGSSLYLVGVFDDEEKAKKVCDSLPGRTYARYIEVMLNHEYEMTSVDTYFGINYKNELYLGGYVE